MHTRCTVVPMAMMKKLEGPPAQGVGIDAVQASQAVLKKVPVGQVGWPLGLVQKPLVCKVPPGGEAGGRGLLVSVCLVERVTVGWMLCDVYVNVRKLCALCGQAAGREGEWCACSRQHALGAATGAIRMIAWNWLFPKDACYQTHR